METLVIAHRTCPPFAPENSLQGMEVAFEQGADGVEIDLRMSLDLQPFLMHDNSMRRTTGWPLPVEATPAFLVRRQRLRRSSEAPPSLSQAFAGLPDGRLLAVDVKTPWSIVPLVGEVRRRGLEARTLIWCSSALVCRYALWRLPGVEFAYYKDFADEPSNLSFIGKAKRLGVQAVSLDWRAIDMEVVSAAHRAELRVYSWHKDYDLTAEKLGAGLDGLITDYPERARQALEEFASAS